MAGGNDEDDEKLSSDRGGKGLGEEVRWEVSGNRRRSCRGWRRREVEELGKREEAATAESCLDCHID